MTGVEWRLEVRIHVAQELTNQEVDALMTSATENAFDVVRDVEAARDPIGLVLVAYFLGSQGPSEVLHRFWVDAQIWLEGQGVLGHVVSGRVCTGDMFDDEALRPDTPELLSAPDVAELLGVSRQRVHQLYRDHPDFPAPYARLGSGPIWTAPAIEAFGRVWSRRPGRPARTAS